MSETKGVLGEKTFKLLRRIPIESVEIDENNRVVLRLLRHVDRRDAQSLLVAVEETLKQDRLDEKKDADRIVGVAQTMQDWFYRGKESGSVTVIIHKDGSCELPQIPWDHVLGKSLFPSPKSAKLAMSSKGYRVVEVK